MFRGIWLRFFFFDAGSGTGGAVLPAKVLYIPSERTVLYIPGERQVTYLP